MYCTECTVRGVTKSCSSSSPAFSLNFGSTCRVFILHVLWYCAFSIGTPVLLTYLVFFFGKRLYTPVLVFKYFGVHLLPSSLFSFSMFSFLHTSSLPSFSLHVLTIDLGLTSLSFSLMFAMSVGCYFPLMSSLQIFSYISTFSSLFFLGVRTLNILSLISRLLRRFTFSAIFLQFF